MNLKMNKSIIITLAYVLINTLVFGQAPQKMSYQAVIRDNANALVINQAVGMQISILQGSVTGTAVYIETHTTNTNTNGLISIEIGGGTAVSGTFAGINWANGPYFVKTETDPAGGTSYSITGTSQLLSVPYALHAKTAENIISNGSNNYFTHFIGEQYGGGVIFHLWKDSQSVEHGLIVDLNDLSTSQAWSNITTTLIGSTAQSSWNGLSNSNAITSQAGHTNSAAALCLNSNNGGQSDWYLPSIDELSILCHNRLNVNKTLSVIANATELPIWTIYWTSSEANGSEAWYYNFLSFDIGKSYKTTPNYDVRAIRAF
jgi:hypothetical protein